MKIKIYGSRASMPFFSKDGVRFGGNTSCVLVETGARPIILDCGSGLAQLSADIREGMIAPASFDILIGHLHIDHIIGLSTFSPLWNKDCDTRIFTKSRNNLPLAEQVFGIFKPPYWPVDLAKLNRAEVNEIKVGEVFTLDEGVRVTPFPSTHPDETTAFRIDADKSLVYLLDHETVDGEPEEAMVDFCRGVDAVIFDATYLPEDYPMKKGWGHSTYEEGIKLAEAASCGLMIFSHFNKEYTDIILGCLADKLSGISGKYLPAYDGMEIII